jgi:FkbH-like protein
MVTKTYQGLVVSDFNADNLALYLSNDEKEPRVEVHAAPYGQVYQLLVDENSPFWSGKPDFAVVWSRPQGVIESFSALQSYQQVPVEAVLQEVDEFASLLTAAAGRVSYLFVPTWVLPAYQRGFGLLDMKENLGLANTLMKMNLRLAQKLEGVPNVYLLNTQRWVESAGKHAYNPKAYYMGKIYFGNDVFKEAVLDIKAGINAIAGQAKKLIVLDLDDTLWGGIVGDDGWENLTLGGHSAVGEAFVDFQKALKALTNRGVVLGIASKNDEKTALEAIHKHPEMVLREEDFAGWKVNWQDKAQNIVDLVEELNLGLQSVVFIDDNPVERARIRDMLPEVLVPDWPEDKTQYAKALLSLACFDTPAISKEDADRTKMYVVERQRTSLRTKVGSLEAWLQDLGIRVKAEELTENNLPRAAQLLNKTNQMNLSTRRMTEAELLAWARAEGHRLWTIRVSDKFGDSGLTGILSVEEDGAGAKIMDFVLSCRVMGRRVEETMAALAVGWAREQGLSEIRAVYLPTKKNRPCLEFWQRSGFDCLQDDVFRWDTSKDYPYPVQVNLEVVPA